MRYWAACVSQYGVGREIGVDFCSSARPCGNSQEVDVEDGVSRANLR